MVLSSTIFARAFRVCVVALVVGLCIFANCKLSLPENLVVSSFSSALNALFGSWIQWFFFAAAGIYINGFSVFGTNRSAPHFWRVNNATLWLTILLLIEASTLFLNYEADYDSPEVLGLLAGIALGQAAAAFNALPPKKATAGESRHLIIVTFIIFLLITSRWSNEAGPEFRYHNQLRFTGPWDNPNTYGLLMGIGVVLAIGLAVYIYQFEFLKVKARWQLWKAAMCFAGAVWMGIGLLHSYSRGAWLGTFCGCLYLIFHGAKILTNNNRETSIHSWIRRNWISLATIGCSLPVLIFWLCRQTQLSFAVRAFSVANFSDFSWRNRIAAWEGSLQMIADRPWFGFGYSESGIVYTHYYLTNNVAGAFATQTNSYLVLGTSLGIPVILCLATYIWIKLTHDIGRSDVDTNLHVRVRLPYTGAQQKWTGAICRSGAILLLVGFWFDGGLFQLATLAPFWILLEVGAGMCD